MFQTEAVLKHFQFLYREVAHKMYAQPPFRYSQMQCACYILRRGCFSVQILHLRT